MKKVLRFFKLLLPHITLILSLMLITFFVIDRFNEAMAFLNNDITKALVLVLSLICLFGSVCRIVSRYKK